MTRLPHADYRRHLRTESARLRETLARTDPDARVPGCPEWSATDLLAHHARVLHFWATIIEQRPAGPDGWAEPARPSAYDDLLAFHAAQQDRLVAALTAADPADAAWSWADEQTVGFTMRRQAHEALIHRLDAEQTAGTVTPLDPVLAADGVEEALAIMFGGAPAWGAFTPDGGLVRVDITDASQSVWVATGWFRGTDPDSGTAYDEADIAAVADPGRDPDVVVAGPAGTLDAWLWRRDPGAGVTVDGDESVVRVFRGCIDQAIN